MQPAKGGQSISGGRIQHLSLYVSSHKKCHLSCTEQREGHPDGHHTKHFGQRHPCSTASRMTDLLVANKLKDKSDLRRKHRLQMLKVTAASCASIFVLHK